MERSDAFIREADAAVDEVFEKGRPNFEAGEIDDIKAMAHAFMNRLVGKEARRIAEMTEPFPEIPPRRLLVNTALGYVSGIMAAIHRDIDKSPKQCTPLALKHIAEAWAFFAADEQLPDEDVMHAAGSWLESQFGLQLLTLPVGDPGIRLGAYPYARGFLDGNRSIDSGFLSATADTADVKLRHIFRQELSAPAPAKALLKCVLLESDLSRAGAERAIARRQDELEGFWQMSLSKNEEVLGLSGTGWTGTDCPSSALDDAVCERVALHAVGFICAYFHQVDGMTPPDVERKASEDIVDDAYRYARENGRRDDLAMFALNMLEVFTDQGNIHDDAEARSFTHGFIDGFACGEGSANSRALMYFMNAVKAFGEPPEGIARGIAAIKAGQVMRTRSEGFISADPETKKERSGVLTVVGDPSAIEQVGQMCSWSLQFRLWTLPPRYADETHREWFDRCLPLCREENRHIGAALLMSALSNHGTILLTMAADPSFPNPDDIPSAEAIAEMDRDFAVWFQENFGDDPEVSYIRFGWWGEAGYPVTFLPHVSEWQPHLDFGELEGAPDMREFPET